MPAIREVEEPGLFFWSNGRVVLVGSFDESALTLTRTWRAGDRLTDSRRWSFDSERKFLGQVRRLTRDASGDRQQSEDAVASAKTWLATCSDLT